MVHAQLGPLWDVTQAASAHATLAGGLAAITLALLGVLTSRGAVQLGGHAPAAQQQGQTPAAQQQGQSGPPLPYEVLRVLLTSVVVLIVSAVIWGGLAGQPAVGDLREFAALAGPGRETAALVAASQVQTATIASTAVTLLAIGGLSFLSGCADLLLGASQATPTDRERAFRTAVALLSAFAISQAAYFAAVPLAYLFGQPSIEYWSRWLPLLVVPLMILRLVPRAAAVRKRVFRIVALSRIWALFGANPAAGGPAWWYSIIGSILAALGYAVGPSNSINLAPASIGGWDWASALLTGAAGLVVILYIVCLILED